MAFDVGRAIAYLDLDITAFNSAIDGANTAISKLGGEPTGLLKGLDTALGKIQDLGTAMTNIGSQLTTNLTVPIVNFGTSSLDAYRSAETAFTGVKKTVDATEEEFVLLEKAIVNMSQTTASTYEEIAAVMQVAGQLGVPTQSLEEFTRTMIMMGDATDLTAEEAALNLARVMNITGTSFDEVGRLGSSIVDLGNKFATQEPEIVLMTNRLASAGTMAGLTTPEILALSTAMSAVGIRAEAGGTAMSTTLAQITKDVANMRSTNEETASEAIGHIETIAKISGVSSSEFVTLWKTKPIEAIEMFIGGLGRMDEGAEGTILALDSLGMSGIRQSNMLRSLSLASETLGGAIDVSNQAWEEQVALTNEAETRYGTTDTKISQLNERWREMQREIGERLLPILETLMGYVERLITWWDNLSDSQKDNIINWGLIAAAIGPALMLFGKVLTTGSTILKTFVDLGSGIGGLIGKFTGLSGFLGGSFNPVILLIVAAIGLAVAGFIKLYNESDEFRKKVGDLMDKLKSAWEKLKPALSTLSEILGKVLLVALTLVTDAIMGLVTWFSEAVTAVADFVTTITNMFSGIIEAVKAGDWGEVGRLIIEGIIAGFKLAWDLFWAAVHGLFEFIWNVICDIFGIHSPAETMKPIGENLILGILEGFKSMFETFIQACVEFANMVIDFFKGLWDSIIEYFSNLWSYVSEFFSNLWDIVSGFFKDIWDTVVNFFSDVISKLSDFISNGYNSVVTFLSDLISSVVTFIGDIISKVVDFFAKIIANIIDFAANALKNVVDFFKNVINNLIDFFSNVFGKVGDGLATILKAIVEFIAQVIKGIIDFFADVFGKIVAFFADVISNVKEFIGNVIQDVIDFFVNLLKNCEEGLSGIFKAIVQFIADVLKDLAEFFSNMLQSVSKLFSDIVDAIVSFASRFFEAGKTLFSNLWEGLKEIWNGISEWIQEKFGWIGDLIEGIKSKLGSIPGFNEGNMFSTLINGSHADGLTYVPFDGYVAELHQGERVLTKQEAKDYNKSGTGGDTYNFYNTKPDPYEYARQMKRVKRELRNA